ncbi:MAG TPA: GNAT family N-acetyltransferase [Ktedonobacteraceae bacterium]|nr:GNAT family N-acetyltransferase [Ktedonobacteraceae bacterium]
MNLKLRKAGPNEIEALHEILRQCGQDMKVRLGLGHWDPPYPLELMRKSVEERSVYAVHNDEQLVATFTVGTQAPTYYRTIPGVWESWDAAGEPALYANRLAVLPEIQGQGIGTWCMQEYERIARVEGYEAIRLDAYDKHLRLLAWYEKLGYHWRGTFAFHTRLHGETGMACYEKMKHDFRAQ